MKKIFLFLWIFPGFLLSQAENFSAAGNFYVNAASQMQMNRMVIRYDDSFLQTQEKKSNIGVLAEAGYFATKNFGLGFSFSYLNDRGYGVSLFGPLVRFHVPFKKAYWMIQPGLLFPSEFDFTSWQISTGAGIYLAPHVSLESGITYSRLISGFGEANIWTWGTGFTVYVVRSKKKKP